MTVFKPGMSVTTERPEVVVDRLTIGRHVFQLVVVDDDGNESVPARAEVTVARSTGGDEPTREEPTREEPTREEPTREEPTRTEGTRVEPGRTEPGRTEPTRTEPTIRRAPGETRPPST